MGWVHRDIKPENSGHVRGVVKLLDFGDAAPLPPSGFLREYKGTSGYRSPEMALCLPYGPSADVYSLGVVVKEQDRLGYVFWRYTSSARTSRDGSFKELDAGYSESNEDS